MATLFTCAPQVTLLYTRHLPALPELALSLLAMQTDPKMTPVFLKVQVAAELGLHNRPSSALVAALSQFMATTEVTAAKQPAVEIEGLPIPDGPAECVSCSSVMAMLLLNVTAGETFYLRLTGPDSRAAARVVEELIAEHPYFEGFGGHEVTEEALPGGIAAAFAAEQRF